MQQHVESNMSQLGANTFQIQQWPAFHVDDGESIEKYRRRERFTMAHVRALESRATLAKQIGVQTYLRTSRAASRYEETNPDVRLQGANPGTFSTMSWVVADGRALTEIDVDSARSVCVLGASLAEKLFPNSSPLEDWVEFNGIRYSVVGVLEGKGSMFGFDQDNFMAIPISTGLNRYGSRRSLSIQVQAADVESFEDTREQVRGVLRAVRRVEPGDEDDFEIVSNDSLIRQFRDFTFAVRAGAGVISSIALLAAGIGIMNIMLVSVTERTREIGIRRAIGAKKRNIRTQFIIEAIVLCEIGGALGVLLGIAAGNAVAWLLKVPPVLPVDWVVFGLVLCSVVGIVFGTYPAWKASNLDPIESLRYE
jgi:putative ABC transport system permease protein